MHNTALNWSSLIRKIMACRKQETERLVILIAFVFKNIIRTSDSPCHLSISSTGLVLVHLALRWPGWWSWRVFSGNSWAFADPPPSFFWGLSLARYKRSHSLLSWSTSVRSWLIGEEAASKGAWFLGLGVITSQRLDTAQSISLEQWYSGRNALAYRMGSAWS